MPKAFFIRETQLERLRQNVTPNAARYSTDAPWLADYFGPDGWNLKSKIDFEDVVLKMPDSTELFDLDNTKTIYTALRDLTPLQASEERLWAYLTHVQHWAYMRKRWPAEQYRPGESFAKNIRERYFFRSDRSRSLIRNGIARLWWYGYTTYDNQRADPFELTAILLRTLDVTQSILERAFSRNRTVTQAVLSVLHKREIEGKPFPDRDTIRNIAKYLVQLGGVTIIDALSLEEISEIVAQKVEALEEVVAA